MLPGNDGEVRPLALDVLGERYRRYRLADPAAEEAMAQSLRRYGQISPVVVCLRDGQPQLIDGFKRRMAAALLPLPTLSARVLELDERTAKAAIFGLNSIGQQPGELEEAWLVWTLVREDGLSQVEVAELLNRHKSWVCRRLALLERLCVEAQQELRLGLLSPTVARQLTQLPVGNQTVVLAAARRDSLTATEIKGVVELVRQASPEQEAFILAKPREALQLAEGVSGPSRDPRLSPQGNRVARQVSLVLDGLNRLENWLHYPGLAELRRHDRLVLAPRWAQLAQNARTVAQLVDELLWYLQARSDHERAATERDHPASASGGVDPADCPRAADLAGYGAAGPGTAGGRACRPGTAASPASATGVPAESVGCLRAVPEELAGALPEPHGDAGL
jgi:ParB-like chromosome segregation protein Spo0J